MNLNQRKHRTQMRQPEIERLESVVHTRTTWANIGTAVTRCHARVRMGEWKVSPVEVLETIKAGQIIEAHQNAYPEVRALFRKEFGRYAVCVVISLTHWDVVTVFVNCTEDRHYTLDRSQYQWRCDLTALPL